MAKNQKSIWKAVLFALVMGGAGLALGYFSATYLKSALPLNLIGPPSSAALPLYIAIGFFAAWLSIAFHELGHLTAGLLQGFRMALYVAGFLGVRGTANGVRVYLNRNAALMGGIAATVPQTFERGQDLRLKFVRIVAAGPLASLLLSVIAGTAFYAIFSQPVETSVSLTVRALGFMLLLTGAISGLIFIATLIPTRSGGFMSDGARLISLLSKGENARYEEANLAITAMLGAGKLPGDYPADMLARLLTRAPDNLLGLNGHYFAFTHHLDRGETKKAWPLAQAIQTHIDAIPGPFQAHYLKDVVFFYAFLAEDRDAAQACWASIQKAAEKAPDAATFRVKAALALLENDVEQAKDFAEKGMAKLADLPFEGQRNFELKWLQAVLMKAHQVPEIA
ncbi:MAG: M50 family metallopeptidase [Bacteroidota bacterium]